MIFLKSLSTTQNPILPLEFGEDSVRAWAGQTCVGVSDEESCDSMAGIEHCRVDVSRARLNKPKSTSNSYKARLWVYLWSE